ncbi:MAG: hypothetical protein AVDCRST_MAG23-922 [uncultured Sphingosinicella sp.]|uniref:Uncharacterized protein n=1 Tax=uncultured Sphingosinicella sp. TaxID=478748 RepID=A0A6J4TQ36_9SPHN|nr:hypothetical protein [uncultured Sphingosinicella sp.]CAA9529333.1 MAG: hypothetical protein AVDCRST_MAG23-922 [uncultured Sphingosinicella sp.]
MKTFECSKEAPWGIHLSLLGEHCPRCGWEAPRPKPQQQADLPEFGWMPFGAMLAASLPVLPL